MKNYTVIFAFLILLVSCIRKDDIVLINTESSNFILSYFDRYRVNYEKNEEVTLIRNTSDNLSPVLKIFKYLDLKEKIIQTNIKNVNTTRTVEGDPYLRQIVTIDSKDNSIIEIDKTAEKRLIYDPTHPEAIRNGVEKGYVEYPNIDILTEYIELIQVRNEKEIIKSIINRIDESIIIPQIHWRNPGKIAELQK